LIPHTKRWGIFYSKHTGINYHATQLRIGEKVRRGRQTNGFLSVSDAQTQRDGKRPRTFDRENFDVYFGEE
jgi:hypothetical protein